MAGQVYLRGEHLCLSSLCQGGHSAIFSAQSQLWDELIKGYSRRQLWLGLRFPAIILLKSKDMLKVIEGKHSRVILARDEVLQEITEQHVELTGTGDLDHLP